MPRHLISRMSVGILFRKPLCEDTIPPPTENLPPRLLQQDAKRQQGRLVHAPLVDAAAPRADRHFASVPALHGAVELAGIGVYGLEQVAVREDALPAAREMPVMRIVDIMLCVARGRVLSPKQDFIGTKGSAAGGMADDLRRRRRRWWLVSDEVVLGDSACYGVVERSETSSVGGALGTLETRQDSGCIRVVLFCRERRVLLVLGGEPHGKSCAGSDAGSGRVRFVTGREGKRKSVFHLSKKEYSRLPATCM